MVGVCETLLVLRARERGEPVGDISTLEAWCRVETL